MSPRAAALCLSLLAAAIAAPAAHAATITPNVEPDVVADDGHCSLREAITAANTDARSGATPGECAAGSGPDTVQLPPGLYVLSIAGVDEDANATGDLDITSDMSIAGAGAGTTKISAARLDRVLQVAAGATATIDGVTVTDGLSPSGSNGADAQGGAGQSATGANGGAGEAGGGILNAGNLTVSGSVVSGNQTGDGGRGGDGNGGASPGGDGTGGVPGAGGAGGGIFSSGALVAVAASIDENATGSGGRGGSGAGGTGTSPSAGNVAGGPGGTGHGLTGAGGGAGGGVGATGQVSISASMIAGNVTGDGGVGGGGAGGDAGDGSGSGSGGHGGSGSAGAGGTGGAGGGIAASGPLDLRASTLARNRTGTGGAGTLALGGSGGVGGSNNGNGGTGGQNAPGTGGTGGAGAGVSSGSDASITDVTVDSNVTGPGGSAGQTFPGGRGGDGQGFGNGGDGGSVAIASGGSGGGGGGLFVPGHLALASATVTRNRVGSGVPVGVGFHGVGGNHGNAGGSNGSVGADGLGAPGHDGSGGGVFLGQVSGVSARDSILAANAPDTCDGAGALPDGGGNVRTGGCPGKQADPLLGPLEDNGGGVFTRSLRPGSPALDGADASCPATDARGVARPQGAACDVGAYEHALPAVATGGATAVTGSTAALAGGLTPNGATSSYHFEYGTSTGYGLRTPATVIGGVAGVPVGAALTGLAAATTYHYRLVATNADGTAAGEDRTFTTAASAGPGSDRVAPVLTRVSAHPPKFRTAGKGKHGTSIRFTLSEKARVTFTVSRTRKRKQVTVGRFTQSGKRGKGAKRFAGKLHGHALKPGRYRVTLVAVDAAGNKSKSRRLSIKVLARR